MNLNDLEIIKIVQANPCLYAKDAKTYKNIDKKHCWEQVGAALIKPRTSEAVQKRWDNLRTMFVRAHRKRMEYIPSGSGAMEGLDESNGIDFAYYADISFLIPHYKPRMTRSNMKAPISIQIPSFTSPAAVAEESASIITPTNSTWNLDFTNSISIVDNDDSCSLPSMSTKSPSPTLSPTSSPTPVNKILQKNLKQVVPFSPSIKAMNSKNTSESESGSSGTSVASKFKHKANTEVVIPPSDISFKRKKNAIDGFLGETAKIINRMASTVETVVSSRGTKTSSLPQDNELTSLSVTIAYVMQDVPKTKRRLCLVKILQIIEEFIE
nr:PREDICTED: uncharacterized protein LOC105680117 [Linepithema humile]